MIPSVAHFVWLGNEFPWLNVLAIVSAATGGGFERIVLHQQGTEDSLSQYESLTGLQKLEVRPLDVHRLADAAGVDQLSVCRLFDEVLSVQARSDIVRALVLAAEGGVYLDTDTITLNSFSNLRNETTAFIGEERICFPGWSAKRPPMFAQARAYGLALLRWGMSFAPRGYRWYTRLAPHYSLWANNAVLGCVPHHPFIQEYLETMLALPLEVARRRYAIGPDLLERIVGKHNSQRHSVVRMDPSAFYPLPPVLSRHWWKFTNDPRLDEVLSPSTLVVHWYASNRNRELARRVNRDYVLAHKDRQLLSKLAAQYVHLC